MWILWKQKDEWERKRISISASLTVPALRTRPWLQLPKFQLMEPSALWLWSSEAEAM